MGVKSLSKFLSEECPEVFVNVHISNYAFKRLAVDTSLYMYKFKATVGEKWLAEFLNLVICLRSYDVHCVFCYDMGAPPEKEGERDNRRAKKQLLQDSIANLTRGLEEFEETGNIPQDIMKFAPEQGILRGRVNKEAVVRCIKEEIAKKEKQDVHITQADFDLTRELFDILGVPWYNAPLEAETMCCDLRKRNLVEGILTDDSDVLAYGASDFLTKFRGDGWCIRIMYEQILDILELTSAQFLDLCIMCGTDYNKNIPKVGPKTAYKHLLTYGRIEELEDFLDISVLNHERGRELFREYPKSYDIESVPYCKPPDFKRLLPFLDRNCVNINHDRLRVFSRCIEIVE